VIFSEIVGEVGLRERYDLGFISTLAANGILMTALPIAILGELFLAAVTFAFILDTVKLLAFRRFAVA
jgi:H+-transporting ATPase